MGHQGKMNPNGPWHLLQSNLAKYKVLFLLQTFYAVPSPAHLRGRPPHRHTWTNYFLLALQALLPTPTYQQTFTSKLYTFRSTLYNTLIHTKMIKQNIQQWGQHFKSIPVSFDQVKVIVTMKWVFSLTSIWKCLFWKADRLPYIMTRNKHHFSLV